MKATAQEKKKAEQQIAWESWEMLLYDKILKGLDTAYMKEAIICDLSAAGMPKAQARTFVEHEAREMAKEIRQRGRRTA